METENGHGKESDMSQLKHDLNLPALKIPMRKASQYLMKMNSVLFNSDISPNIIPDPNSFDKRILLLNPKFSTIEELPEGIKSWIKEENAESFAYNLQVDYASYSQDQLLKKFLPEGVSPNVKMTNIGHVKILNLDENQKKYKKLIGKIILDKNEPHTKTILLKHQKNPDEEEKNVYSKYFLEYNCEFLCGEAKTNIDINEGNCNFKVNLLDIYYDSALQEERERMLSTFGNKTQICDLFGDMFLDIRLAKNNSCKVFSNCEQNESKFATYNDNIKTNDVEESIVVKNVELGQFLKTTFEKEKPRRGHPPLIPPILHVHISKILTDLNFLKMFVGLFTQFQNPLYDKKENLPKIHFYCLINNSDFTESMRKVLTRKLNEIFSSSLVNNLGAIVEAEDFLDIYIVDSDFPDKRLLQVTLSLTPKIAFWEESLAGQIIPSMRMARQNSKSKAKITNPPKDIEEVEKELEEDPDGQIMVDGVRKSTRVGKKPKSFEDFVEWRNEK